MCFLNFTFLTALQVYRHVKDVAMVWSLEDIRDIEERKLLAGHISMYLSHFDVAQVCSHFTYIFSSIITFQGSNHVK